MEVQRSAAEYEAMIRAQSFEFGPENVFYRISGGPAPISALASC